MAKPFALLHVSALVLLVLHILPHAKSRVKSPESLSCVVSGVVSYMPKQS